MTDTDEFVREALPHRLEPYEEAAARWDQTAFVDEAPHPFFLYARSKLWDPALLMAGPSRGDGTAIVQYSFNPGGMVFLSAVRKRQSPENDPAIYLGRNTATNDLVIPVSTLSSNHARLLPPSQDGGSWTITDLGSTNGTYHQETRLAPDTPTALEDGVYLRLGGNLIAWFVSSARLWWLFRHKEKLDELIEL